MVDIHDEVEILLRQAAICPSTDIRDRLIEFEVDYQGRFVGYDLARAIWHRLVPDSESGGSRRKSA